MSVATVRLEQTFEALGSIARRLQRSIDEDAAYFPVSESGLSGADAAALKAWDAFLQRFQQAADHILRKLFPRVLAAADEMPELMVFREVLDRLHRLDVIEDIETWTALQQLRNRLTHDDALAPAELAQDLSTAWAMSPLLLAQIERSATFADRHHLRTGGE